ncbi:MAG: choice-of-anchor D domain-containing protein [Candidatus Eisenbacteria bacterium]|uniref:Choice-of-anchor D domain-containing protein n=1 Tax=Eiseniibacteriota bacterium TaxID=2212470 RepID=A0A538T8L9_UNCEI|nr:MAG: choice-of-anchor D domain-containing protein [Candidatus Eisenbacteria bacterium]
MRNRAFLNVVLLGLLTFALAPGLAGAASQGQDLTGMLASSAAERAAAVSGPVISVSPTAHNFGRVNVGGTSATFDFTIRNTGDATLTISALNHSNGTAGFNASAGTLPRSITPGASAIMTTSYTPNGSGPKSDNVTIVSNASNGNFLVLLQGTANNAPVYNPPLASDYTAPAFVEFSLTASANDQESDPLSWTIASTPALPVGATFDGSTGTLKWTPNSSDAGDYAVTITVTDGAASTPGSFTLHVTANNRPPTANPGGPYSGVTGVAVSMDGSQSSDPDAGQTLTFSWNFGDGASGSGPTPSHAYASPGNYIVGLTVTDNGSPQLSNTATTGASIVNFIRADIVRATGANDTISTSGNGQNLFGIETFDRPITDIDVATIRMSTTYPNAGTVSEIVNSDRRTPRIGDINGNVFADLDVHFRSSAIRQLLLHVPSGTRLDLVVSALTRGDRIPVRGTISMVKIGSSQVISAAAPNPFKRDGTAISYRVGDSGPVSVRIFSVNGALVRSLREEYVTPGAYEVRWNGKDDGGRTVPSGIYFVSVKQGLEASTTRVVLAR